MRMVLSCVSLETGHFEAMGGLPRLLVKSMTVTHRKRTNRRPMNDDRFKGVSSQRRTALLLTNEFGECLMLSVGVIEQRDASQDGFGNGGTLHRGRHGEHPLLDFQGEAEKHHDLRDQGAGDALPAGDVGLVGDCPGIQFLAPGEGLAEEFDHMGRLGFLGRLRLSRRMPKRWDGACHAVGGHLARQDTDTAIRGVLTLSVYERGGADRLSFAAFPNSGGYRWYEHPKKAFRGTFTRLQPGWSHIERGSKSGGIFQRVYGI